MKMTSPSNERPVISIEASIVDKMLSMLSWVGCLFSLIWVLRFYASWPEIVPVHFDLTGKADGYGHKATLFFLPITLIGITTLLQWLSQKPHLYNYPTDITPENAAREYMLASKMIRILNAVVVSCLTYVIVSTHNQNGVAPDGPSVWFLPLLIVGILGTVIGYLIIRSRN